MGPQAIACGDLRWNRPSARPLSSFNGAAGNRLRRYPKAQQLRQRLHASMGPQAIACGDGHRPGQVVDHQRASMGPQAIACGDVARGCGEPRIPCFNGAAGNRLRRSGSKASTSFTTYQLQWGRRQSPAEIVKTLSDQRATRASMGPQAIACGDTFGMEVRKPPKQASMGPQAIACGDRSTNETPPFVDLASMGPQAIACGDTSKTSTASVQNRLQWGRRQSPAEIRGWSSR